MGAAQRKPPPRPALAARDELAGPLRQRLQVIQQSLYRRPLRKLLSPQQRQPHTVCPDTLNRPRLARISETQQQGITRDGHDTTNERKRRGPATISRHNKESAQLYCVPSTQHPEEKPWHS